MNIQDIFVPEDSHQQNLANSFEWKFDSGPVTSAEHTLFAVTIGPTIKKFWRLSGTVGSRHLKNLYAFSFSFAYVDDNPIDHTYTLTDGLYFNHTHSITSPSGQDGFRVIQADSATVEIKLDPIAGTATGTFSALFINDRLQPHGSFNLLRDDVQTQP